MDKLQTNGIMKEEKKKTIQVNIQSSPDQQRLYMKQKYMDD